MGGNQSIAQSKRTRGALKPFRLLDLPEDVIERVFASIFTSSSLIHLSETSSTMQQLVKGRISSLTKELHCGADVAHNTYFSTFRNEIQFRVALLRKVTILDPPIEIVKLILSGNSPLRLFDHEMSFAEKFYDDLTYNPSELLESHQKYWSARSVTEAFLTMNPDPSRFLQEANRWCERPNDNDSEIISTQLLCDVSDLIGKYWIHDKVQFIEDCLAFDTSQGRDLDYLTNRMANSLVGKHVMISVEGTILKAFVKAECSELNTIYVVSSGPLREHVSFYDDAFPRSKVIKVIPKDDDTVRRQRYHNDSLWFLRCLSANPKVIGAKVKMVSNGDELDAVLRSSRCDNRPQTSKSIRVCDIEFLSMSGEPTGEYVRDVPGHHIVDFVDQRTVFPERGLALGLYSLFGPKIDSPVDHGACYAFEYKGHFHCPRAWCGMDGRRCCGVCKFDMTALVDATCCACAERSAPDCVKLVDELVGKWSNIPRLIFLSELMKRQVWSDEFLSGAFHRVFTAYEIADALHDACVYNTEIPLKLGRYPATLDSLFEVLAFCADSRKSVRALADLRDALLEKHSKLPEIARCFECRHRDAAHPYCAFSCARFHDNRILRIAQVLSYSNSVFALRL